MIKHEYLYWMANNTPTQWCNDSALMTDIDAAMESGAIGCTSNPPLTFEALTVQPELYKEAVAAIPATAQGDDRVVELLGVVVRNISRRLTALHETSGKQFGYIRSQVQPKMSGNGAAMHRQGLKISTWGKNVMVKIPGTCSGIQVLEELAAAGIPTTPTVCVSVAQILAAAEANERGIKRAMAAGLAPAASTAAIVMGRLQDYLTAVNQERRAGISTHDLETAALAVAKRCYALMKARGYRQILMPAAFRAPRQVSGLVGAAVHMTIHPKIQAAMAAAEAEGSVQRKIAIDDPDDADALARVAKALPEFTRAYDPAGLKPEEFDAFGATVMTLDGFDKTGWQKLYTL
jgi:transaldolase